MEEKEEAESKAMLFTNEEGPITIPDFQVVSKAPELVEDMTMILNDGDISSLGICKDGTVFIYGNLKKEED